ncbi:MAG: hypothetical protein O3A84_06330 [Proteobacteria bacterium]|nr:hypothetical protein [Pseudomonadota bacterium]
MFQAGPNVTQILPSVREFLSDGCDGLISFGVAGALNPDLRAGDLVLADRIIDDADGNFATDRPWAQLLEQRLSQVEKSPIPVKHGALFSSRTILASVSEKNEIHRTTGADAVDMESFALARICQETETRFIAVRAIADTASHALPIAAQRAVSDEGKILIGRIVWELLKRPQQLPQLLALSRPYGDALSTLRCVAALGGVDFGLAELID